ncbi:hypothetical protein [Pseudomonas fulva]|uniref:hypothetical protein n=1 Tax=Pseudomonas fulva TaxID=47880 RepID=UPI001F20A44C|nr:hypothetical protein [Pseudomonas fulva]
MKLDRALQRRILMQLSETYPRSPKRGDIEKIQGNIEDETFCANLHYLHQHGLIGNCVSFGLGGQVVLNSGAMICTAKGMDFLADDGGLGAILDTVTVKLHEDTLRLLVEAKVQSSNLPEEQKSSILKALREAPGETTKQLITKLVDLGMENAPKAIPLIQTLLQGGQP